MHQVIHGTFNDIQEGITRFVSLEEEEGRTNSWKLKSMSVMFLINLLEGQYGVPIIKLYEQR